jgi:hypothetical protein
MFTAFLFATLLGATDTPPTFGAVQGLSPEAVGDLLLAGQTHGVVERVAPPANRALMPPGFEELVLTERASPQGGACVRRSWTVVFSAPPGAAPAEAALSRASAVREVGLLSGAGCGAGEYVRVNGGLAMDEALAALRVLGDLRTGRAAVRFACSDDTRSGLCATPDATQAGLASQRAWLVTRKGAGVELWLGTPGGPVTAVAFLASNPVEVTVNRRVPPPA